MKKRISLYIFLTSFLFIILFLYLWFNNENENKNPGTVKTILRVAMWKDSSTDKNLDIIESFMSMYPDVQVEVVTFLPDTYSSSLDTLLNGQQPVDVFFIHELTQLTNLSEKGVLKPLDFLFSHSDMDPGPVSYTHLLFLPETEHGQSASCLISRDFLHSSLLLLK